MVASQADLLLPREVADIFQGVLVPVLLPSAHKRYRREEVEALLRTRLLVRG